jgi:hypothetical protein
MRKFAILTGATVAIGLVIAVPAEAATTGSTTTTFTLGAGLLSITAPASVALGAGSPGVTLTAPLGPVTVSDLRGALAGSWTASVTTTSFTTGTATAAETIPIADVSYASGVATATAGVGVMTPGQATNLLAQDLSVSRTSYSATATVGNTSATWNPSIDVAVPSAAVVGTYTGTITNSVA